MSRSLGLFGITLSLGLVLALGSAATAAAPPVDASPDTVICNTVIGTVAIKPALVNGGTATSTLITVKGTLNGCSVTGPNPVTVLSGSFSGKLTGTTNNCTSLLGSATVAGSLTVKWKTVEKLLDAKSVVTPGTQTGGVFGPTSWGAGYGQFNLGAPGTSVTGSFQGGNGGATSTAILVTGEDLGATLAGCAGAGMKTFHIGIGQLKLQ
jgi:hypothetical protein